MQTLFKTDAKQASQLRFYVKVININLQKITLIC